MVMRKVLPCPFCGRRPIIRPRYPLVEGNCWGSVTCMNHRCPSYNEGRSEGVSVNDGVKINDDRGSDAYKNDAIRRWNIRHG